MNIHGKTSKINHFFDNIFHENLINNNKNSIYDNFLLRKSR